MSGSGECLRLLANCRKEVFTPTALSVSGLTSPITAETTITTTDYAGQTVAIAIAAGAGIVAGGAIAAWLFKPVPGAPPAPTEPPTLPTVSSVPQSSSPTPMPTTSTSEPYACPFPSTGYPIDFSAVPDQAQWTLAIPSLSTSSFAPGCTQQGSNNQLLRGTDPGYITVLAQIFCKSDLSKDQSATLGQADLPSTSGYKNAQLDSIRVKFDFKWKLNDAGCAQNCVDAYQQMLTTCQYNSHVLHGGASLQQGCGTYDLMVDADPNTKLTCNPIPNPIFSKYEYRDGAINAITSFCTARDGHVLKQNDPSTYINELDFSASYADNCQGSGTYGIGKDLCVKYLMQTVDGCDTESVNYKHGGTITETDGCGSFTFHPFGADYFACSPSNAEYIASKNPVAISPAIAKDAISQFCDRSGSDQKYTLDPKNIPNDQSFADNQCTKDGYAACSYYYNSDGSRTSGLSGSAFLVRMNAHYRNTGGMYSCSSNETYVVHGDRCHNQLGKLIGIEPANSCVGSDPNKLSLGSFLEAGDLGCVLWNFWAVATS